MGRVCDGLEAALTEIIDDPQLWSKWYKNYMIQIYFICAGKRGVSQFSVQLTITMCFYCNNCIDWFGYLFKINCSVDADHDCYLAFLNWK